MSREKGGWLCYIFRRAGEVTNPADTEVDFWPCSNYVKGHVEKPNKGMILLRPWEGTLGKCK